MLEFLLLRFKFEHELFIMTMICDISVGFGLFDFILKCFVSYKIKMLFISINEVSIAVSASLKAILDKYVQTNFNTPI